MSKRCSSLSIICATYVLFVILVGAVARPTPAFAKNAGDSSAQRHFKKGKTLYETGKYTAALEELKEAYSVDAKPVFMRYMGDCAFETMDYELAIRYYENYLTDEPTAPDKSKIEKQLVVAKQKVEASSGDSSASSASVEGFSPNGEALAEKENRIKKKLAAKKQPAESAALSDTDDQPVTAGSEHTDRSSKEKAKKTRRDVPEYLQDDADEKVVPSEYGWVSAVKWTSLVLGLGGIAAGITFSVLAKQKRDDIVDLVGRSCPTTVQNCGGNQDGTTPQVTYSYQNFRNEEDFNRMQGYSTLGYAVGGGLLLSSAITFLVSSIVWSNPDESYQDGSRRSRYSSRQKTRSWSFKPTAALGSSAPSASGESALHVGATFGLQF